MNNFRGNACLASQKMSDIFMLLIEAKCTHIIFQYFCNESFRPYFNFVSKIIKTAE